MLWRQGRTGTHLALSSCRRRAAKVEEPEEEPSATESFAFPEVLPQQVRRFAALPLKPLPPCVQPPPPEDSPGAASSAAGPLEVGLMHRCLTSTTYL